MKSNDGRTVSAAAVQALLDLGHPYALEVPPESLSKGLRTSPKEQLVIPVVGLFFSVLGVLLTAVWLLADVGPFFVIAVVPLVLTVLGGTIHQRALIGVGAVLQGLACMIAFFLGVFKILRGSYSGEAQRVLSRGSQARRPSISRTIPR